MDTSAFLTFVGPTKARLDGHRRTIAQPKLRLMLLIVIVMTTRSTHNAISFSSNTDQTIKEQTP